MRAGPGLPGPAVRGLARLRAGRAGRGLALGLGLVLVGAAGPVAAEERAHSLADIRQELGRMAGELAALQRELSPTGSAAALGEGGVLDRVEALGSELARLTARTEELEHRIGRIVADGTRRLTDLEFRLVELEGGDIAAVGSGLPLGGEAAAPVPGPDSGPAPDAPLFAVGEEAAFAAAEEAFAEGDWEGAIEAFADFVEAYPVGPLTPRAHALRAQALEQAGEPARAARSWLSAFETDPDGAGAAGALMGLGRALGRLGQVEEACIMLDEIAFRFPGSPEAADVGPARREVGCP